MSWVHHQLPRLAAASFILMHVWLLGCSRHAPATRTPDRFADSYRYGNDDDPGHDVSDTPDCDPNTCRSPLICVHVVTDTTLDVPDRKVRARCVSRDSDLCRLDPEACANPPSPQ